MTCVVTIRTAVRYKSGEEPIEPRRIVEHGNDDTDLGEPRRRADRDRMHDRAVDEPAKQCLHGRVQLPRNAGALLARPVPEQEVELGCSARLQPQKP